MELDQLFDSQGERQADDQAATEHFAELRSDMENDLHLHQRNDRILDTFIAYADKDAVADWLVAQDLERTAMPETDITGPPATASENLDSHAQPAAPLNNAQEQSPNTAQHSQRDSHGAQVRKIIQMGLQEEDLPVQSSPIVNRSYQHPTSLGDSPSEKDPCSLVINCIRSNDTAPSTSPVSNLSPHENLSQLHLPPYRGSLDVTSGNLRPQESTVAQLAFSQPAPEIVSILGRQRGAPRALASSALSSAPPCRAEADVLGQKTEIWLVSAYSKQFEQYVQALPQGERQTRDRPIYAKWKNKAKVSAAGAAGFVAINAPTNGIGA
eukprot:CAMPEP_0198350766 /NCGR_PEP_ID=MMETSP1450-20131203/100208_1 /TAXON_ID=753684 ORGANISM="Madagascaria erythrocladiodes, Strain CCMP3234" /NCGR_SAMPLE_ID=MMETSP1450 /ASSEMBLY_ACC=CAM_ASM_001115 /LENGTH=324 /DNA_ID=CAMNT_0044056623 /DNA_START=342 /DNA_END=1314 /DNA_ORIENTATION=+